MGDTMMQSSRGVGAEVFTDPYPPKLRRSVKPSNWQSERRRWREVYEQQEPESRPKALLRTRESSRKMGISERQRLRKAGDLIEPQINSFDLQPPVAHRVKSTVTFSERQRRRKRGTLNGLFVSEDECYDSLDQLFPGARADYSLPDTSQWVNSSQTLLESWNSSIRGLMQGKQDFSPSPRISVGKVRGEGNPDESESIAENLRTRNSVPEFPTQGEEEGKEEDLEEEEDGQVGIEKEKEMKFRFRLKLGSNGRRLLSGAIAGAFSRTMVAPLETIRTHLMVGSHGQSVSEVFHWIMDNEGWTGLFRGNAINVIRVAPSKAIELFAYDQVKGFLSPKDGNPGMLASLPVSPVAGACAGISSTVCMYPLELLKTRLTIQPGQYRGILHALWRIITEEGFFELYRGLAPSIIGVIPYAGVNYYTYDTLRSLYKKVTKEDRVGNIQTLIIGSLAGAIASTSTFPLEVARKQMQVGAIKGRVVYTSTLDALRGIAKERGIKGLYGGLGPSCLKLMPAAGLSFMCYEALKRILLEEEEV